MVIGAVLMLSATIATIIMFTYFIRMVNMVEQHDYAPYESHYVFVMEDTDREFWDEVYEAASAEAEKSGIYLENIRDSMKVNYSSADLLRVAVNSSVEGIIYAGSASEEATEIINEGVSKGIGIVLLHNDMERSQRQCFVGVNNYEIGQMYASQIIKIISRNSMPESTIALLVNDDMSEGATNLVTMGIEDYLLEHIEEESLPQIDIIRIKSDDTFAIEENIRNIFVTDDELPDVVLCLEGTFTQCVYQAIVDYNHVGEVQVIGYFANDDIIDAIDKRVIHSTISVDTQEMGKSSVLALKEYNEYGYTNSFVSINMEIIDRARATQILDGRLDSGQR